MKTCKHSIQERSIRIVSVEEEVVSMPVAIRMHQGCAARISISSGSAYLLVVPLKTARQRGVNHGANIRLVDTHPEGSRCNHDIQLSCHELFLDPTPPLGIQSGMVAGHPELARSEEHTSELQSRQY